MKWSLKKYPILHRVRVRYSFKFTPRESAVLIFAGTPVLVRDLCDTYGNDGLVVIGTWLVAKSLLLSRTIP